jgi:TetR/AcrR family transcriptional regulator, mexJK operon transcriptional repressor
MRGTAVRQATRKPAARKRRSARGRPPAEEVTARAALLLDVATEVFLEQGFKGASMSEIARRAGASKQTLYARYPSKAALFAALIERKSSSIFEAIGPLDSSRSPRETLIHFGSEFLSMILTEDARCLHRVVIAECVEFPELGEMFWAIGPGRTRAVLADYLRSQHALGTIRCDDPERAVNALLGMLFGEASLRANLGIRSPIAISKADRLAWVNYAVDTFLAAMQTRR